jgi:hypothetical protein
MVLGNGGLVVADGTAHIQGSKATQADASQPGEYGVNQALGGQALKMIGYDAAPILA